MAESRTNGSGVTRREFLTSTVGAACAAGIAGLGLVMYTRQGTALPAQALRPPGALAEEQFSGACVRCGLCVRDCPYDTLKLAQLGDDVALGTPYFTAREIPCEMCEDIPCVKACPTGALDHSLTRIDDSRMGLAVVVDQETCIAFHGLRCEVCFNVCPIRGDAISLDRQHNARTGKHALFIPVVHSDACTGCGKCEQACILEEAAIKVFPLALAKGKQGKHYRLGWEEKARQGGSLVTPDSTHQYNLPEGMDYDYEGQGLIRESRPVPFSSNPLDTLKRGREGL